MQTAEITQAVRDVTQEEVDFYLEHGWVKLERLVSPELAAEMLQRAQAHMGVHGDDADNPAPGNRIIDAAYWRDYHYLAREDREEPFRSLVWHGLGGLAQRFLARDVPMRYSADLLAVKVPVGQAGASTKTNWHQDFPNFAHDRTGNTSFWIALDHVTPEQGSMRFLDGGHTEGPLGRTLLAGQDLVDLYPELLDRHTISPPLHLAPGDATVHGALTIHSAPPNTGTQPRWAYIVSYFPADVTYTGAAYGNSDGIGLTVGQPFDHPRYPIVYPEG